MLISGSAYATAWAAYVAFFIIAYFAFTRLARGLRPVLLRQILKGFLIVLFLTPVEVNESKNWYAPAWLEGGYETVLGDTAAAGNALFNLSVAAAIMAVLLVLDFLWRRRRAGHPPPAAEQGR